MLIEEPLVDLEDSASWHDFDDFEDSREESPLGLREKTDSLVDYLRTQHESVARHHFRSMSGLPPGMELMLYDCLIHQLGRELNCHD